MCIIYSSAYSIKYRNFVAFIISVVYQIQSFHNFIVIKENLQLYARLQPIFSIANCAARLEKKIPDIKICKLPKIGIYRRKNNNSCHFFAYYSNMLNSNFVVEIILRQNG